MSLPCSGYDILPTILLTFSLKVMNFFISHVALMMRNVLVTLFFTFFSPLEPPKSIGWLVRWSNSEGSEFVYFAGIKLVSLTAFLLFFLGLDGSQRRVTMTHDATKTQLKFISFYTSQTQFIHTLFTHHHIVFLVTWTRSSGAWRGSFLLAECTAWWARYKNIGLETSWALIFFIASCVNSSVP